jgi:hypothetical protein
MPPATLEDARHLADALFPGAVHSVSPQSDGHAFEITLRTALGPREVVTDGEVKAYLSGRAYGVEMLTGDSDLGTMASVLAKKGKGDRRLTAYAVGFRSAVEGHL